MYKMNNCMPRIEKENINYTIYDPNEISIKNSK